MPNGFEVGLSVHERRRGAERRMLADRRGDRERRVAQRRHAPVAVKIERRARADRREDERRWHARRSGEDRRRLPS